MKPYVVAVAYIVIVIVLAHLVAPDTYVWTRHTISELAAQGYARAWIMRLGFWGFGALVVLGGVRAARKAGRHWPREIALAAYGAGIFLAGVFSTAPFVAGLLYDAGQARLHSLFATAAGVSISLAMVLYALTDKPAERRVYHALAAVLTLGLSALFGVWTAGAGIVQRLLWAVGFLWLILVDLG